MIVFNVSICRLAITLVSLGCLWKAEVKADAVAQDIATAEPIWNINVGTSQSEHSVTLSSKKSWSFNETLPTTAENCSYHLVMTDALGNAVAIWCYFDTASNRNVLDGAQLPSDGKGWTAATRISKEAIEDVASFDVNPTDAAFKLLVGEKGATAIWNAYIDGMLVVRSSTLSGGIWSTPTTTKL
jgi:hypothetical protein